MWPSVSAGPLPAVKSSSLPTLIYKHNIVHVLRHVWFEEASATQDRSEDIRRQELQETQQDKVRSFLLVTCFHYYQLPMLLPLPGVVVCESRLYLFIFRQNSGLIRFQNIVNKTNQILVRVL